jgi:high affinity Mn2+ porin
MRDFAAVALLASVNGGAAAQGAACDRPVARALGAQVTLIGQRLAPFHSPYRGALSLDAAGERQLSQSYGAYGGACLGAGFEFYVDAEMVRGAGISHAAGLAGITNGRPAGRTIRGPRVRALATRVGRRRARHARAGDGPARRHGAVAALRGHRRKVRAE